MTQYSTDVHWLRRAHRAGVMRSVEARVEQLRNLERLINENELEIYDAVYQDIQRSHNESYIYEVSITKNEIKTAIDNIRQWAAPDSVDRSLLFLLDSPYVHKDSRGVVLVIGAWNYPINVIIIPLVSALAAGNCAIIKPSEMAGNTASLLERLVPKYLSQDVVRVVCGGVTETTELLKERFDHIFYTGNPIVGRIIYEAAAKHLTPVTLELGGKCPAIVDDSSDISLCAKRIAWGKFMSCGQTCLAPDYVLCSAAVKDQLVKEMAKHLIEFYTADAKKGSDYSRIINNRHFKRLQPLIHANGQVLFGGDCDEEQKYISPTIVDAKPTDPIMKDEIFGPILPIITIASMEEAIDIINDGEKPLATYIFSKNSATVDRIINETSSGGVSVNDCLLHFGCDSLPFGGVGNSGFGKYHGKWGFDELTHHKAVLKRGQNMDSLFWIRYPPLDAKKMRLVRMLAPKRPIYNVHFVKQAVTFVTGLLLGVLVAYVFAQQ